MRTAQHEEEPSLIVEPGAEQWSALARSPATGSLAGKPVADWRRATREQLGLPRDRTIVATGHQAAFWHPGILAKFMMMEALVASLGRDRAVGLHVVVDQDMNDATRVEAPARDEEDRLLVAPVLVLAVGAGWTMYSPYEPAQMDRVTGAIPACVPVAPSLKERWGCPSVAEGLARIHAALRRHTNAPSIASQVARSVEDLMRPWVSSLTTTSASRLMQTSIGQALIDAMRLDPRACAGTYNAAVANDPDAGLTALEVTATRVELPLWRIDDSGRRHAVFATDLDPSAASFDSSRLRPRALTMTALVRMAVCDLFIHGRGGWQYDRAMESWLRDWLGVTPAPMVMATADLRLPIREADEHLPPLSEAIAAYRSLMHDPPGTRRGAPSIEKQALLDRIAVAPRRTAARRRAFDAYQNWLVTERTRHQGAINEARQVVERSRRFVAERAILARRDWAFPFYPDAMLDALSEQAHRSMGRSD